MKLLAQRAGRAAPTRGFTLAEVAVTLLIVGMALTLVMQGVAGSKLTAGQSANRRLALDLARETMSRIEAGSLWEELDGLAGSLNGSYAEEGYDAFFYEIVVGEDENADYRQDEDSPYFDSYAYRRYQELEYAEDERDEEAFSDTGSTGGSFEKVVVTVTYPNLLRSEQEATVVLERWLPLEQVFGRSQEQIDAAEDAEGGS